MVARRPRAGISSPRVYRSALAHRDLRLLMVAMLISMAGSWAYNVALLAVVYDRTGSLGWVGAATLCRFIPQLVFSPYAGVLADRFERVRLMVCCDLAAAATQAALVVLVLTSAPVAVIIFVAALTSLACTPYEPAVAAVTPQIASEEDLAAANSLRGVIENVVQVSGPALGAVMLFIGPAWAVFGVNAASFLLSAVIVARMRLRSRPVDVTEGGTAGPLAQLEVGLRAIAHSRPVAMLVALSVLASMVYGMDTVLFVGASEYKLGLGPDGFGVLMTGLAVGGLLAAPLVNPLASSPRLALVLMLAMLCYCLPNIALALSGSTAVAVAAQVVRGAGTLIVDVLAMTALQRAVAPDVTARVFGVFWALILGAIALGALVAPPVVGLLGLTGGIVALALAPALLSLAAYPTLARMDRVNAVRTAVLAKRVAALEATGLFAAARRPVLERLAAETSEIAVSGGELLIREGDPADALYVLRTGSVEVGAGGDRLAELGAGSWFGELGLLEGIPRTATVRTTEPCTLLRIDGDAFLDALTAAPLASTALEGARARFTAVRGHEPGFSRAAEALA
jgi:Major Facilitator Superfamily/Cyclic nucleotide-binding domain